MKIIFSIILCFCFINITFASDTKNSLINSITHLNPKITPDIKEKIVNAVIISEKRFNIPPLLIICLIKEESNFNPEAHNRFGATGLMQVIPRYHQDFIVLNGWKQEDLFNVSNNVTLGTSILKKYLKQKDGDIVKALEKYVGASESNHCKRYIRNILSNYINLQIKYF